MAWHRTVIAFCGEPIYVSAILSGNDMRDSGTLTELLNDRLRKVDAPANYSSLRQKLIRSKPIRELPIIEESPENVLPIEKSEG